MASRYANGPPLLSHPRLKPTPHRRRTTHSLAQPPPALPPDRWCTYNACDTPSGFPDDDNGDPWGRTGEADEVLAPAFLTCSARRITQ